LGMKKGLDGQTRAQKQGDFLDNSNEYSWWTIHVHQVNKSSVSGIFLSKYKLKRKHNYHLMKLDGKTQNKNMGSWNIFIVPCYKNIQVSLRD
jgi:hypothetical protein